MYIVLYVYQHHLEAPVEKREWFERKVGSVMIVPEGRLMVVDAKNPGENGGRTPKVILLKRRGRKVAFRMWDEKIPGYRGESSELNPKGHPAFSSAVNPGDSVTIAWVDSGCMGFEPSSLKPCNSEDCPQSYDDCSEGDDVTCAFLP